MFAHPTDVFDQSGRDEFLGVCDKPTPPAPSNHPRLCLLISFRWLLANMN